MILKHSVPGANCHKCSGADCPGLRVCWGVPALSDWSTASKCRGQNLSLQPWRFWDSPANWGRQFEAADPALNSAQGLIFSTIAHLLNAFHFLSSLRFRPQSSLQLFSHLLLYIGVSGLGDGVAYIFLQLWNSQQLLGSSVPGDSTYSSADAAMPLSLQLEVLDFVCFLLSQLCLLCLL